MSWEALADIAAAFCFLLAGILTVAAGVGAVRFSGLLARIHAATKPQVLGFLLALVGLALRLREFRWVAFLILVGLFQLLTVPVAYHLVARAGYRTGKVDPGELVIDELVADIAATGDEGGGDGGE